jgi:hypothetical protein
MYILESRRGSVVLKLGRESTHTILNKRGVVLVERTLAFGR